MFFKRRKQNIPPTYLYVIANNSHFTSPSLLQKTKLKTLCVLVVKLKTISTSFLSVTNTIAFEATCLPVYLPFVKVRKRAKISNQYNQAPYLTQDTNGKVTTSQLDITNESQDVSPFPAGDHNASINRRARKHNKNQTEITSMIHKEAPP